MKLSDEKVAQFLEGIEKDIAWAERKRIDSTILKALHNDVFRNPEIYPRYITERERRYSI